MTELVQVTLASSRGEVGVREIRALLEASEALRCRNLTVMTWDYDGVEKAEGRTISFKPLWKWLLEPSGTMGK